MHAYRSGAQRGYQAERFRATARQLVHGIARNYQCVSRFEFLFEPIYFHHPMPLEDYDHLFTIMTMDRCGGAGIDGLHPDFQCMKPLQRTGNGAV